MSRSIGLAYAITGAALASAVFAVTASTAGLFDGTASSASLGGPEAALAMEAGAGPDGAGTQYVYVDEPARRTHDEHERYEHRGRGGREDDDD